MNCNIELLYKTIRAQMENDLFLTENNVSDELKKRCSHEASVLCSVLSLIENEDLLKRTAAIYEVV